MTKETKKEIGRYAVSSISLLGFSLVFSLFSLIFIVSDKIPAWARIVVSFIFIAPTIYIALTQGKAQGERLFKAHAKTTLSDLHGEMPIEIPYYKCVFHVLGFVVPLTVVYVIAVILKSNALRLAAMIFEFPVALLFSSAKVIKLDVTTPLTLAVFIPYTLIVAGVFVFGYIRKILQLKKRHAEIKSELRSFDN